MARSWHDVRDAWDTKLRVEQPLVSAQKQYYIVRSAGPDKKFDTADDLVSYLEVRTRQDRGPSGAPDRIDVEDRTRSRPIQRLARDRGRSSIRREQRLPERRLRCVSITTGKIAHGTRPMPRANSALAGVPPGDYEIRRGVTGFKVGVAEIQLSRRATAPCYP